LRLANAALILGYAMRSAKSGVVVAISGVVVTFMISVSMAICGRVVMVMVVRLPRFASREHAQGRNGCDCGEFR
jgi:hypothetical protein